MTRDIATIIKNKLLELEQNLLYLKQVSFDINADNIREDVIRYWGIERGIQVSIENIIYIANIIVSVSEKENPNTYRETMTLLGDIGVVTKTFATRLANMVGFRNILVHDYTKVDSEIILNILKEDINDFIRFSKEVTRWMKENGF